MKIRFWGVRGSVPAPLSAAQIQSKISAAVAQISIDDLRSEDIRQSFLAKLPEHLYGTVGSNTACIEIENAEHDRIIFDAGTGIRLCGKQYKNNLKANYHILFSHFHWDHIQGLPFFDPVYCKNSTLHLYSAYPDMKNYLSAQMTNPYFPVRFDDLKAHIEWHHICDGKPFAIGNTRIVSKKMFHPGDSHAYAVFENGKRFIYATDVELRQSDFECTEENTAFFKNADVMVCDAQYTVEESVHKEGWGHSVFCYAVDFAVFWNIKHLYLFHHEPEYDDKKIYGILQSARWYADYMYAGKVAVHLATEGAELDL